MGEEAEQIKRDGLKGTDVLASVGMRSAGTNNAEDDPTDIGDLFSHDSSETEFVQQQELRDEGPGQKNPDKDFGDHEDPAFQDYHAQIGEQIKDPAFTKIGEA